MPVQTIRVQGISREDLDAVIAGLEVACGGNRIEVSEGFDVLVKAERQAIALEALFSGEVKREKARTNHIKANPKGTMGALSYRIVETGEIISKTVLNKRLMTFPIGTLLENAKGERFQITTDGLSKNQPLQ